MAGSNYHPAGSRSNMASVSALMSRAGSARHPPTRQLQPKCRVGAIIRSRHQSRCAPQIQMICTALRTMPCVPQHPVPGDTPVVAGSHLQPVHHVHPYRQMTRRRVTFCANLPLVGRIYCSADTAAGREVAQPAQVENQPGTRMKNVPPCPQS
jgi:hypothetical protein